MVPRYSLPLMSSIWTEQNKFSIWFKIEKLVCEAQAKLGVIPLSVSESFPHTMEFDPQRINEIESHVKHDVIAFLTYVAEEVGIDVSYMHYGMTSSDVLDTCLAVQLKASADILLEDIKKVLAIFKKLAQETKYMPCIGRSHGVHAEPVTFGLKLARFYAEFSRNYRRLKNARDEIAVCKISGAVGNFANIDPYVEQYVAESLGLDREAIASQIIPRDRHAMFFATLGVIASSIENVAVEIRSLQKTEVLEVEEGFSQGQKGSSAMPHKRNPVLSENLTGLSRIIRGFVNPALENVALWHERDISHSSVERFIAPDACITLNFALDRLYSLLDNLIIYPDRMLDNLHHLKGMVFSQRVLLALVNAGLSREAAYKVVQDNAMRTWKEKDATFFNELIKDERLTSVIDEQKLEHLFDYQYYMEHVDFIFDKVFAEE